MTIMQEKKISSTNLLIIFFLSYSFYIIQILTQELFYSFSKQSVFIICTLQLLFPAIVYFVCKVINSNKIKEYELIHNIAFMSNIHFIHQKEPKGLGHAVLCGKSFVGDEPFAVLLGDDVVKNRNGLPALRQLIDAYNEVGCSILGVQEVARDQVNKYGVVNPVKEVSNRLIEINDMIEKPSIEEAPSNLAVLGRYVLNPEIFESLENTAPGKGGEIQLTDAVKILNNSQNVYAYNFEGERYDVGDRFGFIKATIDFALEREDLKERVLDYIKHIAEK